jgi:hypothetical protein
MTLDEIMLNLLSHHFDNKMPIYLLLTEDKTFVHISIGLGHIPFTIMGRSAKSG